jgi:cephalosporin-C deacetylase-like acetyl esterase
MNSPAREYLTEVEHFYAEALGSGPDRFHQISELAIAPGGEAIFFSGTGFPCGLHHGEAKRVYRFDLRSRVVDLIGEGPASLPSVSSDGWLACRVGAASDRVAIHGADLHLRDVIVLHGRIETIAWSPTCHNLAVVVSDSAGSRSRPARRKLWLLRQGASPIDVTPGNMGSVWEAIWINEKQIAIVASEEAGENGWYGSLVYKLDLDDLSAAILYIPQGQIGCLAAAPDGRHVAFVEGLGSDRGVICGACIVVSVEGERAHSVRTGDIEATSVAWRDPGTLHIAGLAGLAAAVIDVDIDGGRINTIWRATSHGLGTWNPISVPFALNRAIVVAECYAQLPFVAELHAGALSTLFNLGPALALEPPEPIAWPSDDGSMIEGWLFCSPGRARSNIPLLVDLHGGPAWSHQNRHAARLRTAPFLIARGCTVLRPNPRGSTGRGQLFARAVVGDVGGVDAADIRSGIDHLVATQKIDRGRIGLTGGSYGGYLSAWMSTMDSTIAAVAPISPVTDWRLQHDESAIPAFDALYLGSARDANEDPYTTRSPLLNAQRVKTPTLLLAGLDDVTAPARQASLYHAALMAKGTVAECHLYPSGGHGLRGFPLQIDVVARLLGWFDRYLFD